MIETAAATTTTTTTTTATTTTTTTTTTLYNNNYLAILYRHCQLLPDMLSLGELKATELLTKLSSH